MGNEYPIQDKANPTSLSSAFECFILLCSYFGVLDNHTFCRNAINSFSPIDSVGLETQYKILEANKPQMYQVIDE